MTSARLDPITEAAIDWLVLLRSGEAAPGDHRAFARWLDDDARHRQAWERLAGPVDGAFAAARAASVRATGQAEVLAEALEKSHRRAVGRRRVLRGALVVAGVGTGTGIVAQRFVPLQDSFADLRTATGERRSITLPDGSIVRLNARSAVDVDMAGGHRRLRLRSGEVIVEVRGDANIPLVLACRDGAVHTVAGAADTRFLARQDDARSLVVGLRHSIIVAGTTRHRVLAQGEGAWLDAQSIVAAGELAATAAAWEHGVVSVHDRPLGEVVAALRPYRRGFLRISPDAARLHVYGSYPLDDTDRTLAILAETLPITVQMNAGGWMVRIDAA